MPPQRKHGTPTRGHSAPGESSNKLFTLIGDVVVFLIRWAKKRKADAKRSRRKKYQPKIPARKVGRGKSWQRAEAEWDKGGRRPEEATAFRLPPRAHSRDQRLLRVGIWRATRPLVRFHRQMPTKRLLQVYLIPLGVISIALTIWLFPRHGSQSATPATTQTPAERIRMLTARTADQLKNERVDAALKNIEELRTLAPNDASVENLAGTAYAMQKKYDDARSAFKKALEIDPNSVAAKNNLAEIEFSAKRYAEAETLYRDLLPKTPRRALTAYHIYLCLLMQDRDKEAEAYLTLFPAPPSATSPAWYFAKAGYAFNEGKKRDAERYLADARRYYPELAPLYEPSLKQLGYIK